MKNVLSYSLMLEAPMQHLNNPTIQSSRFAKCMILLMTIASAVIAISPLAIALPEDSQQPIHISSDSAIRDDKRGLTIYEGDVDITQGTLNIRADKVTIYSDAKQVTKMIALGKPARFKQKPEPEKGDVIAKADTIEYRVTKKIITLTDNASLDQDGSKITGDKIDYDINAARIEAAGSSQPENGNGRVNVVIPPAPSQNTPE